MSGVTVVGAVNIDLVTYTNETPQWGMTLFGESFQKNSGGKGSNVAVAAARLRSPGATVETAPRLVACVGDDADGHAVIRQLRRDGVVVDGIFVCDADTGKAPITVRGDGENQILVVPGANMLLDEAHVEQANLSGHVVAQLEVPLNTVAAAFRKAKSQGAKCILNPSPLPENKVDEVRELCKLSDMLVLNEHEAEILRKDSLLADFDVEAVVVTLGAKGARLITKQGSSDVPIPSDLSLADEVADTTGAGDCFLGALAHLLSTGASLGVDVLKAAVAVAAASTRLRGTQPSYRRRMQLPSPVLRLLQAAECSNEDEEVPVHAFVDHTLLKPTATQEQIEKLVREAVEHKFRAVCINPCWVPLCRRMLNELCSEVMVCTVVGFPLGANMTEIKAFETARVVEAGADEVDMVANIGAIKAGDFRCVKRDVEAVVRAAGSKTVKVILETCLLTDDEIVRACRACVQAGADFVKTSTGFSTGGATLHAVSLMHETVASRGVLVKAAGGVRTRDDAIAMIRAGKIPSLLLCS
ncbi:MAG: hypothetical protein MHM6MM_003102 [Cercozoa sp. M6MM]